MCSRSSFLDREIAAQSLAYHAHGTAVTNPAVIRGLCAMTKHEVSNAHSAQARPSPPLDDKLSY